MIKEPRHWSQPITYHLYANTENFIAIDPMVIVTSKNTHELNPELRGCYFDVSVESVIVIRHDCFSISWQHEYHHNYPYSLSALSYSRDNCIAVCLQLSVFENCRCTMPLYLPPLGKFSIQKISSHIS